MIPFEHVVVQLADMDDVRAKSSHSPLQEPHSSPIEGYASPAPQPMSASHAVRAVKVPRKLRVTSTPSNHAVDSTLIVIRSVEDGQSQTSVGLALECKYLRTQKVELGLNSVVLDRIAEVCAENEKAADAAGSSTRPERDSVSRLAPPCLDEKDSTSTFKAAKSCHKRPANCDWADTEASEPDSPFRLCPAQNSPQTSSDGSPFLSLLARDHGPFGNMTTSTSFASTLDTLESLVPKLRYRYNMELNLMRGQVAERDLAIERLRNRVRKRPRNAH